MSTMTYVNKKVNRDDWIKQIGFFRMNCKNDLPIEKPDLAIANLKKGEANAERDEAVAVAG